MSVCTCLSISFIVFLFICLFVCLSFRLPSCMFDCQFVYRWLTFSISCCCSPVEVASYQSIRLKRWKGEKVSRRPLWIPTTKRIEENERSTTTRKPLRVVLGENVDIHLDLISIRKNFLLHRRPKKTFNLSCRRKETRKLEVHVRMRGNCTSPLEILIYTLIILFYLISQSVNKICIAPIPDPYSEALPTQAKRKRTVFSRWWNQWRNNLAGGPWTF